jgi:hypothetical protein
MARAATARPGAGKWRIDRLGFFFFFARRGRFVGVTAVLFLLHVEITRSLCRGADSHMGPIDSLDRWSLLR